MAALAHRQVEGTLAGGVVQEDGVAVTQLELHIAQRRLRTGTLHHPAAIVDVHVIGRQITGASGQDFTTRNAHGHRPRWIGHHGCKVALEAGGLVLQRTHNNAVGVNGLAVFPIDHDGRGGIHLDTFGLQIALQPAAALEVQGDLAGAILGTGPQRALCSRTDPAIGSKAVTDLEAAYSLLQGGRIGQISAHTVGGGLCQIAFGHQTGNQRGDAGIAGVGLDQGTGCEGRPATVTGNTHIADITCRQVLIADILWRQFVVPV